jgi:hypothetical protein
MHLISSFPGQILQKFEIHGQFDALFTSSFFARVGVALPSQSIVSFKVVKYGYLLTSVTQ